MPRTFALVVWAFLAAARVSAQQEVIAVIQVHGNTITPSDQIISASELKEGSPFSESVRLDAENRLRSSRRFHQVEVLKRYASISDLTQITVLIQVDDGPVRIDPPIPGPPGVPSSGRVPLGVRRGPLNVMFAPIFLNARRRLRVHLRCAIGDHGSQKHPAAGRRPAQLGWRQACGRRISEGVFPPLRARPADRRDGSAPHPSILRIQCGSEAHLGQSRLGADTGRSCGHGARLGRTPRS